VAAPDDPANNAAFTEEALRLNDRYVREVVEAFNVCPFARGARLSGAAVREVDLLDVCDASAIVEVVERYERGSPEVSVVQVIYPRLKVSARAFDALVSTARALRAAREPTPPFALAPFHPDFALDASTPDALVAFFRRTPDPTIQLVRRSVIDALTRDPDAYAAQMERFLRGEAPPPPSVASRITRDNFDRVMRDGPEVIAAIYAAIARDRRA
jgi:hypothetical protein